MKQAARDQKETTHNQGDNPATLRAGLKGSSLAPPHYGIDIVDKGAVRQGKFAAGDAPIQRQNNAPMAENRTGLPDSLKGGLEQLSGQDLSGVRVHYNSSKPARLNAWAYTQGRNIHIGPGQEQYLPHEGWHAVQQMQGRVQPTIQSKGISINDDRSLEREADVMGAKALRQNPLGEKWRLAQSGRAKVSMPGSPATIQRAMKLEFQTRNYVWRTMGEHNNGPERLPRKFGPHDFLHKAAKPSDAKRKAEGKEGKGIELQSENEGYIEFETATWFRKWSALEQSIQDAVAMTRAMDKAPTAASGRKKFPFNVDHLVRRTNRRNRHVSYRDYLRPGEELEVEIVDSKWRAAIQSSEDIELTQYESLLREHEKEKFSQPTISGARKILEEGLDSATIPKAKDSKLHSFLQIIVNYIIRGQRVDLRKRDKDKNIIWKTDRKGRIRKDRDGNPIPEVDPAKYGFRLMSRTSFSAMFKLLNDPEKELFQDLVAENKILDVLNELNPKLELTPSSRFFKYGHGGGKGPTIQAWLNSIIKPKKRKDSYGKIRNKKGEWVETDLLSRPSGGSHAMGAFDVETEPDKKDTGLIKFEVRGTGAHGGRVQPADEWVAYARRVFEYAAEKRQRTGLAKGTTLKFDAPEASLQLEPRLNLSLGDETKLGFETDLRLLLPTWLDGKLKPFVYTGIGTGGLSAGVGAEFDPLTDMSLFLAGKAGIRSEWFKTVEIGGRVEAAWAFGKSRSLRLGIGGETWQRQNSDEKRTYLLNFFLGTRFDL